MMLIMMMYDVDDDAYDNDADDAGWDDGDG